jgi:hypothetical protein
MTAKRNPAKNVKKAAISEFPRRIDVADGVRCITGYLSTKVTVSAIAAREVR